MMSITWYNAVAIVVYIILLLWAKNISDQPRRDYDIGGLLSLIAWADVTLVFTLLWGDIFWW